MECNFCHVNAKRGPIGFKGTTGQTGPSGPSGMSGIIGPSGPIGPPIYFGSTGQTGPTGQTGASTVTFSSRIAPYPSASVQNRNVVITNGPLGTTVKLVDTYSLNPVTILAFNPFIPPSPINVNIQATLPIPRNNLSDEANTSVVVNRYPRPIFLGSYQQGSNVSVEEVFNLTSYSININFEAAFIIEFVTVKYTGVEYVESSLNQVFGPLVTITMSYII